MKKQFVRDLLDITVTKGTSVELYAWVKNKRNHKFLIFFDMVDSSLETIQVVVDKSKVGEVDYEKYCDIVPESALHIKGIIQEGRDGKNEILCHSIDIISLSSSTLSPRPREDFDIFNTSMTDHLLKNRHMYLRNSKMIAIMKYRSKILNWIHNWFHSNGYTEVTAPILTQTVLYDNDTALGINVHGDEMFLTQCAGYYLEASAHALEKVYNIGPSFRGEESRSKRHLMEYYHIKAEVAFCNIEEMILMVENLITKLSYITEEQCDDIFEVLGVYPNLAHGPFPRIKYRDAIKYLKQKGYNIDFGVSLGQQEEEELAKLYNSPFWVVGIPEVIEPFPYCIDSQDSELTVTADLILNNGFGELLGVAEKIYKTKELKTRMMNKGKYDNPNYKWIIDVHESGCVPHAAFGMGLERLIRWLLNIPHVRDVSPFPRVFRRKPYP